MTFGGDADYVRARWLVDPTAALGAESAGELIGSNFLTNWLYQKFGFWPQFLTAIIACEAFAASRGLEKLVAGVNTSRISAYRQMLTYGFKSFIQGVAMQRSEDQGYNRPDVYVVDDWR